MTKLESRDYQDRVVDRTIGYLEGEENSVLIESPTGSGKSIMGLRITKYLEDKYGYRTNWIAMRRNLLKQVRKMNDQFFGCQNLQPVSMFDKNPPEADLTVVDEAEHDAAASCVRIHVKSKSKMILGLSATPFRTDKLRLSFQRTVKDAGIHRLIQEGYLTPYKHWCLDHYTPATVADAYLNEPEKWGKSVVFFHQIAQCQEFASYLAAGGHHCEVITGQTDRETQLDAFERDEFDVVANVAILNEGFDFPRLQTIFVRDSAKLPTIQMAGRGFRICEGKTHCNIVQSKGALWQFTRTAKPAEAYMLSDDGWLALGTTDKINEIALTMAQKLAQIPTELPKFIISHRKKKRRRRA